MRKEKYLEGLLGLDVVLSELPVNKLPPAVEVLGAGVAIVNVVGMLPNVAGEERGQAILDGVGSIVGASDGELALAVDDEPSPTRTEVLGGLGGELLLELLVASKVASDHIGQLASRDAASLGRHAVPVEGVVPDLKIFCVETKRQSNGAILFSKCAHNKSTISDIEQEYDVKRTLVSFYW